MTVAQVLVRLVEQALIGIAALVRSPAAGDVAQLLVVLVHQIPQQVEAGEQAPDRGHHHRRLAHERRQVLQCEEHRGRAAALDHVEQAVGSQIRPADP
ncbi:hypothetical protein XmelCFBP4644_19270 [Xanthomonas melonis]|uniref:Uncharacterized protein n=1 Tax=Xanthomonas melonis TaxID=56456 RepID=A0A2S7DAC6_9XANT|nr:hypothetical protein XmelCFBP4644_19270 [Xanthomonas melonis]